MLTLIDTVNIPEYALSYLIKNDDSGLYKEDKKMIDKWVAYLPSKNLVFDLADKEPETFFTWNPEFGLPCTCVEVNILSE